VFLVSSLVYDCLNAVTIFQTRVNYTFPYILHHKDWSYRDVVHLAQTYSQKQRDYFSTTPAQRFALLRTWGFPPSEDEQSEPTSDALVHVNGHG